MIARTASRFGVWLVTRPLYRLEDRFGRLGRWVFSGLFDLGCWLSCRGPEGR